MNKCKLNIYIISCQCHGIYACLYKYIHNIADSTILNMDFTICSQNALFPELPDNPDIPIRRFTGSVLITSECGENYIRTNPGHVKEPTLSHLSFFNTKIIPKLNKLTDDKNLEKMGFFTLFMSASDMYVWIKMFLKSWSELM